MGILKVKVMDEVADMLAYPTSAEKLFNLIDDDVEKVIFDFEGVEFSNRSFMQKYIYKKINSNIKVHEINMNEELSKMYDIVYKNYEDKGLV